MFLKRFQMFSRAFINVVLSVHFLLLCSSSLERQVLWSVFQSFLFFFFLHCWLYPSAVLVKGMDPIYTEQWCSSNRFFRSELSEQ